VTTASLARRLDRAEAAARADFERRWKDAACALVRGLSSEQRAVIDAWHARPTPPGAARCVNGHVSPNFCDRCIVGVRPPALLRALWDITVSHVTSGTAAVLPPEVAQIYIDDPDAVPARSCVSCGYLLPMRAKVRLDGTYRFLASYEGACPVCEHDTREAESPEEPS
jgi:hypothetical protein